MFWVALNIVFLWPIDMRNRMKNAAKSLKCSTALVVVEKERKTGPAKMVRSMQWGGTWLGCSTGHLHGRPLCYLLQFYVSEYVFLRSPIERKVEIFS